MKAFLDFILFRKLVAPGLIKMTFWLGCLGSVLASGKVLMEHGPIQQALTLLIITPLFIRICCEFVLGVVSLAEVAEQLRSPEHKKTSS